MWAAVLRRSVQHASPETSLRMLEIPDWKFSSFSGFFRVKLGECIL